MRRVVTEHWRDRVRNQHGLNTFFTPRTVGKFGIPILEPEHYIPDYLWSYNERKKFPGGNGALHFFLDDYWFQNVWFYASNSSPWLSTDRYRALLTPDFSLYRNWSEALLIYNVYRSRWMGAYWRSLGYTVIPTANWSTPDLHELSFAGMPTGGTIAICTMETSRDCLGRELYLDGFLYLLRRHTPSQLVCYGKGFRGELESIAAEYDVPLTRYPHHRDLLKIHKARLTGAA